MEEEKKEVFVEMTRKEALQLGETLVHAFRADQRENYKKVEYYDGKQDIIIRIV